MFRIHGTSLAVAFGLLATGCVNQSTRPSSVAVADFAKSFTAATPSDLASAVQVTAPRVETPSEGTVHLKGNDGGRDVKVRLLQAEQWKGVRRARLMIDPASASIAADQVPETFGNGITARDGEIHVSGYLVKIRLNDVEFPTTLAGGGATMARASWAEITLDFLGPPNPALAAIAMNGAAGTMTGRYLMGGD